MYKLYTDKVENFEAKIKLEGASLKKSKARLVIEASDFHLMFKGTISESGKVKIPVKKLRGLLDEDTKGKIKLEVIAEDTFFTPWESNFQVDTSKKLTVEIQSQQKPIVENINAPKVEVQVMKEQMVTKSEKEHVINIVKMLIKEKINLKNLTIKRNKLNNIIGEYITEHKIADEQKTPVINKVIKVLQKRR
tara:strand:- start:468 stop:1043 length:576 start_codon:yes stop_codon:yes gene_type:complete